jgi:hypothetical protein
MIRLTLLLLAAPLSAAEITIEPEAPKLDRGGVVRVAAKTEGKTVVWLAKDDGLVILPVGDKSVVINAPAAARAGTYRVLVITATADKPEVAEIIVTVTTPEPPPLPPVPPPPPLPLDELPKKLKAAYDAEANIGKRGQVINLYGIYSAIADAAEKDASITTSRALLSVLNKVAAGQLVDGVLMDLRHTLSAETKTVLGPPSDLPLDRARATTHFRRLAGAIEPLTK